MAGYIPPYYGVPLQNGFDQSQWLCGSQGQNGVPQALPTSGSWPVNHLQNGLTQYSPVPSYNQNHLMPATLPGLGQSTYIQSASRQPFDPQASQYDMASESTTHHNNDLRAAPLPLKDIRTSVERIRDDYSPHHSALIQPVSSMTPQKSKVLEDGEISEDGEAKSRDNPSSATITAPVIDLSHASVAHQAAVLIKELSSWGIQFEDLVKEGLDVIQLRLIYASLELPFERPVDSDKSNLSSIPGAKSPVKPAETTIPVQQRVHKLDRKSLIAQKLAEKAAILGSTTLKVPNDSPRSPATSPSTLVANHNAKLGLPPKPTQRPKDSPSEIDAKRRAQAELARKRMEALRQSTVAKLQMQSTPSAKAGNQFSKEGCELDSGINTPSQLPCSPQARKQPYFSPKNPAPTFNIPGLSAGTSDSIKDSSASSPKPRTINTQNFDQPTKSKSVSPDCQVDSQEPNGHKKLTRHNGQSVSSSVKCAPLHTASMSVVIDVSSDEEAGSDALSQADGRYRSRPKKRPRAEEYFDASVTGKRKFLLQSEKSITSTPSRDLSVSGSKPLTPKAQQPERLRTKQNEIEEMNRRIEQLEKSIQLKKAKRAADLCLPNNTQAIPDALDIASSEMQIENDQSSQQADALDTLISDTTLNQQQRASPHIHSDKASTFDSPMKLNKGLESQSSGVEHCRHTARKREIEIGLPLLEMEIEKSKQKLMSIKLQEAEIERAINDGLTGRRLLLEELSRLNTILDMQGGNKPGPLPVETISNGSSIDTSAPSSSGKTVLQSLISQPNAQSARLSSTSSSNSSIPAPPTTEAAGLEEAVLVLHDSSESSDGEISEEWDDTMHTVANEIRVVENDTAYFSLGEGGQGDIIRPTIVSQEDEPRSSLQDRYHEGGESESSSTQQSREEPYIPHVAAGLYPSSQPESSDYDPVEESVQEEVYEPPVDMGSNEYAMKIDQPSVSNPEDVQPFSAQEGIQGVASTATILADEQEDQSEISYDPMEIGDHIIEGQGHQNANMYITRTANKSPAFSDIDGSLGEQSMDAHGSMSEEGQVHDAHDLEEQFSSDSSDVRPALGGATSRYVPYESPLQPYVSYRFHPLFATHVKGGHRSLTYSPAIHAYHPICSYELRGVCNDATCGDQHFRSMLATDAQIITQMLEPTGITVEEQSESRFTFSEALLGLVKEGEPSLHAIATTIAKHRRRILERAVFASLQSVT